MSGAGRFDDPAVRDRLASWIAAGFGARGAAIREARLLAGGAIQQNWLLDLALDQGGRTATRRLVLRTDAPSGVAVSHGRAEEYRLLQAAHAAGVTVPEPLLLCEDTGLIGKPFYLMAAVAGTAAPHRIVRDQALGGPRPALVERLGEELARIHAIRPPRADLAFLPLPEEPPALALVDLYRRNLDSLMAPRPALEWGLRWLEVNVPDTQELILCHRDFRTGNYMLDEHGLTGILDWEFAGWGDPHEDLAWFCTRNWRFGAWDREAGGIGDRETFYRGYERASGRRVDRALIPYWEVMANVRWGLIAVQQGERHLSGEEPSLDLALTGRRAAEMEFDLLRLIDRMEQGRAA
jgi:aminoglycoside phosphotransferase (APT) family kinase protein